MRESSVQSDRIVAVRGGYGYGNLGDDALMVAVAPVINAAFPNMQVRWIGKESAYLQALIPDATVLKLTPKDVRGVGAVVYGGGTQWYSFPGTTSSLASRVARYARVPTRIPRELYHRGAARQAWRHLLGRPSYIVGAGVGPFLVSGPRMSHGIRVFSASQYSAVRDPASIETVRSWGVAPPLLRTDLCYLPSFRRAQHLDSPTDDATRVRSVGVIIRDWPHTREGASFVHPLLVAVDQLRANGIDVSFISFAEPSDKAWMELLRRRGEVCETWNPSVQSIQAFLHRLARLDAFISARYHGAVFASLLGRPVVCIEVEQKLSLVSQSLGSGSRLWKYPFEASECLVAIEAVDRSYGEAVDSLRNVVEEQTRIAQQMESEVLDAVARQHHID